MIQRFHSHSTISLLLLSVALAGCSDKSNPITKEAQAPRAVTYATITDRPIDSGLSVSGQLLPREEAAVAPQLSGYQVKRVLADQGQYVQAGQPLAMLDETLLRADIAQQEAAVAQASVAEEQARTESARVAGLGNAGVLSAEALAQRVFAARTAQAQLKQAQAQLADRRVRERLLVIRAPVAGLVLERAVRPGDVASPSTIMFRIAKDGQVELNADIPERDLPLVRAGEKASVTLANGRSVEGRVRLVGSEIDAQSRLGRARVLLPVHDDIRAGGFASAVLQANAVPVRSLPEAAVTYDGTGASITTIGRDDKVSVVRVRVGRRGGGYAELIEGPPAGTRVLLRGQNFVIEGDIVKPVAATEQGQR